MSDPLRGKDISMAEHSDTRSTCPKCGEWRDSPDSDCAGCGYDPTPTEPGTPQTAAGLDAAWRELEIDALASDGRISDADVKNAIRRNRPRIEAEVRAARDAEVRAAVEALQGWVAGTLPGIQDTVPRAAVLAILDADTPS